MSGLEKPSLEIADIFEQFSHRLGPQTPQVWKVIRAIKNCRTSVLGGHSKKCDSCDHVTNAYNSCRNRHCPKCQFSARVDWIEAREQDLLPCQYFHVVFTIPAALKPVFLMNKRICYDLLFKAASETIKDACASQRNLGAQAGAIGVLHTWSQNLIDHPHVHFIVPGGGLTKDSLSWKPCKKDYFVSVRVLSKLFRGKLLDMLRLAFERGKLDFFGQIEHLSLAHCFDGLLSDCAAKDFVVYAKPPFAGPEAVIKYLGQYTHRIAISNYRLVKLEGEIIFFKVRDNENPGSKKVISLHVKEFMRRFLLHVLPKGFVRIRHFGFLSSRIKKVKIVTIRMLMGVAEAVAKIASDESRKQLMKRLTGIDPNLCPSCQIGTMMLANAFPTFLNSS